MSTGALRRGVQVSRTHWQDQHLATADQAPVAELASFNGTIHFATGETATFAGIEVIDIDRRDEPFEGTLVARLADGSVSHQGFSGRLNFRESPAKIGGDGRWWFLWGTGRFAGLEGGGDLAWTITDGVWRAEFHPDPLP